MIWNRLETDPAYSSFHEHSRVKKVHSKMPIDFDCAVCKHRIRVPDGAEGKRTKCPKCQAIQPVPSSHDDEFRLKESEFEEKPPAKSSSSSLDDVFGPLSSKAKPPVERNSFDDPKSPEAGSAFEAPSSYSSQVGANAARAEALEKIQTPALICVILTGLGIASNLIVLLITTIATLSAPNAENAAIWVGIQTVVIAFATAMLGLALYGAFQARDLKNFGLAWAGFIIALLPCSLLCILTIPISVWGMMVLSDASVQRQFTS
ncbi:hypothetical protein DTL42_09240 [Bremerella cremea]|uniref:Uncharacterized protein n=1 Tax=Bremerella cremea TaxID=1031537 RepID=A0A368KTI5_9BACT|nr:hypothetical protein [Bremerella cremea]RCS52987.1 hypothetical protein DTL42_09240 [Bremerella cremea]